MTQRRWLTVRFADDTELSAEVAGPADCCRLVRNLAETLGAERRPLAVWTVDSERPEGVHR